MSTVSFVSMSWSFGQIGLKSGRLLLFWTRRCCCRYALWDKVWWRSRTVMCFFLTFPGSVLILRERDLDLERPLQQAKCTSSVHKSIWCRTNCLSDFQNELNEVSIRSLWCLGGAWASLPIRANICRFLISMVDAALSCAARNSMTNAVSHRADDSARLDLLRLELCADVLGPLHGISIDVSDTSRDENCAPLQCS